MQRRINKDIDAYKGDFFKGLTMRETICGGIAIAVGTAVICAATFAGIPTTLATLGVLFISGPILLIGFYQNNGMSFIKFVSCLLRLQSSPAYKYISQERTDMEAFVKQQKEEVINKSKEDAKKGGRKNGKTWFVK